MTTEFALLTDICGLSTREAADMFEVRRDTAKSWSSGRGGRYQAPPQVLDALVALAASLDRAAREAVAVIDQQTKEHDAPDIVELGLASDDHEAQQLGLPAVGAHRALLARVVALGRAKGYHFQIVPRASTVPTAAAAQNREGGT